MTHPENMTVQEVAEFFRVTKPTVYLWYQTIDDFPRPFRVGKKKLLFRREDIEKYRKEQVIE